MKQFITKDIDYTGCHPDIANALRQGKAIRCKLNGDEIVWSGQSVVNIIGYCAKDKTYITDNGVKRERVKPIQAKRILKDPVSIMKILVEEGWVYKADPIWWLNKTCTVQFSRWDLCGKEVKHCNNYPENFYTYEEE